MENIQQLKQKTVNGFFWNLAQKIAVQLISFVVSVVLARLLSPNDYGVVALSSMFLVLIGIFIDNGLGTALVQKKDADDIDFNTIFYASLVMSGVVYTVVFFSAPFIAKAYDNPLITPILRVIALGMPIGSLGSVQSAFVSRNLLFKKSFIASMWGTILSGVVGLTMAYMGMGAWALVGQSLTSGITSTIALYSIISWHPRLVFSWSSFKQLYSYGWKFMASSFIGTFCSQLKGYIIGFKYTAADLAFYNRGEGLPSIVYNNINATINSVLFPALSRVQENRDDVRRGLSRAMRTSSFILMPALLGLAALADKLVVMIFTEKWIPAIPFMYVICVNYCIDILNGANLQALRAIGRVDIVLKLEIYKKPIQLATIIICAFISPLAICIGLCIFSAYVFFINSYPNVKQINYSMNQQFMDIAPNLILSMVMAGVVYLVGLIEMNQYLLLVLQIIVGVLVYGGLSLRFNRENYLYVKANVAKAWSISFEKK